LKNDNYGLYFSRVWIFLVCHVGEGVTLDKNKPNDAFIKHIYWLTKDEEARLREELVGQDIEMVSAKGVVCRPLDGVDEIASVAPEVWNQACSRQGSWYRASDKNGLYLVISSFELEGYEDKKAATITESDFDPPKLAGPEEKKAMIRDPQFARQVPPQWGQANDTDKRIYLRWARRFGSEAKDFEDLHVSHTANHANFIRPRFFVKEKERIIPYSIDRTAHLCSCCLELFQVLGTQHEKKLVAPCPGATIFGRRKPNRYLLVEKA
jgi:hypothetical protein